MKRVPIVSVLVLVSMLSARAVAGQEEHPIQLSLLAPVQLVPEEESVRGVRLTLLYGKNASVTGVDLALIANHTTRDFLGVQFGLVGYAERNFTGAQLNWGVNVVEGAFEGLQWGFVNSARNGRGVQVAAVNHADRFRGLQIALVNYAETLDGVQLGLVNIIRNGGAFPVMVLVNWSQGAGTVD
jgi:hypothetical protein